jgi:hypothetical protein
VTTIWVAGADGSDPVQLATIDPAANAQLLPYGSSSDGSHLLLIQNADAVDGSPPPVPLFAVPIGGGEPAPVGLDVSLPSQGSDHANGRLLVTGAAQESWTDKRIALLAPDASSHTFLTEPDNAALQPRWSPDGSRIAYVSAPDLGLERRDDALASRRIWLMDAGGGNQRQLTTGEGFRDAAPQWSTDGRYIVFARLDADDECGESGFDLMLYDLEDGSVESLAPDLPLGGTMSGDTHAGQVPACDWSIPPAVTDILGSLNLSSVLNWWQPPAE